MGAVSPLLFDLRPNYGGDNEDNGILLQKGPCVHCCTQSPQCHHRPTPPPETPGHSQASLGQSLVGSLLLGPGVHKRRLLRVPCTARRSNQSILKEINYEYSLEGLMLKLKLQYFGHLV